MSILIKGMEMPESCRSCPLCVFIGSSPVCTLRKYPFDTVSQYFYADKKPTYCPIICYLPEGHGRLDAADALEAADAKIVKLNTKCADLQSQIYEMENEIEELMPKEGEWIMCKSEKPYIVYKCSVCGGMTSEHGHYCPNCGARMRKGGQK